MNIRKIVLLSSLLIVLAGSYYLYEVRWTATRKDKAETSKKILHLDDDKIQQITLKNSKGTTVLEKTDKDWFLTEPIKTPADSWVVEQIVDSLAEGSWEREITPLPNDLADFGLSEPQIEVTLSGKGLARPEKVLVGAENPTGNMRYIRVNQEKRLLLVHDRFKDALDKGADDIRDKHIIRFEEDAVKKMEWGIDGKRFVAEKKQDKWTVVGPAAEKIDENQINSLIWRLGSLRFKRIFEKPEYSFSYYGLDDPRGMIRLTDQNAQLIGGLSFGVRKEPGTSYYAKAEGSETVFELSYDFLDNLPRPEAEKDSEQI